MAGHLFDEQVHMIRHDAPGNETVALAIEVEQGILDKAGNPFVSQIADSVAGIFVLFNAFSECDGLF